MRFYIKKKGAFTFEIKYMRVFEDTLYLGLRGFNSAVDKKIITTDDLREYCKTYNVDQIIITDYDYSPETRYVLTVTIKHGVHQYYIQQNNQTLVRSYL